MCPQSLMARVLERTGVLPNLADEEGGVGGKGVICTVMNDIVGVAQLLVSDNSSLLVYTM
jgi:hypothetical protein